jgi:hypothetical protein
MRVLLFKNSQSKPTLPSASRAFIANAMLSGENDALNEAKQTVDASNTKGESPAVLLDTIASLLQVRSHSYPELDGKIHRFCRRAWSLPGQSQMELVHCWVITGPSCST